MSEVSCSGGKVKYTRKGKTFCRKRRNDDTVETKEEELRRQREERAEKANCDSDQYAYTKADNTVGCRKKRARNEINPSKKTLIDAIRRMNMELYGVAPARSLRLSKRTKQELYEVYSYLARKYAKQFNISA